MKLNEELYGLGFKEPVVRDEDWDCMVFTNEIFNYKVELFDDGSWDVVALPSDHERTIICMEDFDIIKRIMEQLGHDESFWKGER